MGLRELSIVCLKLCALGFMFVLAPAGWSAVFADRVAEAMVAGAHVRLVKFGFTFAACILAISIVPFLRSDLVRISLAVVVAVGFAADQAMLEIFGHHFSLELSILAWVDRANAAVTLPEYQDILVRAVVAGILIAAAFVVRPPLPVTKDAIAVPFVLFVLAGSSAVLWSSKFKNYSLPAPMAWPSIVAATFYQTARDDKRPRREISDPAARVEQKRFRHVVFIVDESVRGDRLTINDKRWDTTPFLASRGSELANFGVAVSGTNCSNTSRMLMRFGGQPRQLPDTSNRLMEKPTVWQYARNAGYKTIHLDPFRLLGSFHSGMSAIEAQSINEMISVAKLPMPEQDPAMAKLLPELLARSEPSFIYVNKNGAHPVFSMQYPQTLDYDPKGLDELPLDDKQREVIRHYHKALKWSVDGFFKEAWPALLAPDVLTIYTSDHGLALFEGGFAATHCSIKQPAAGEGMVPLFVVSGDPAVAAQFQRSIKQSAHAATHFDVFPTVLWALGYPQAWIEKTYSKPLIDPTRPRQRKFWIGALNSGDSRSWTDVDEARQRLELTVQ
jgi:glucan phosphoethanolaminetransferase (alkaline phosphatase superfamily)